MQRADMVLAKLLARAEQAAVRDSRRAVQESFVDSQSPYWALSLDERDAFHYRMQRAAATGAVELLWAKQGGEDRPLERVRVADTAALAQFLGVATLQGRLGRARTTLAQWASTRRVLEVLAQWEGLKLVRGIPPEGAADFADALRVLDVLQAEPGEDHVVRSLSVRVFSDSKRIEALNKEIDVLTAEAINSPARHWEEVYSSLGMKKEPQPFLVGGAGHLQLAGDEMCPIVRPFVGVANHAVHGYTGMPAWVLTVENLATFHTASQLLNGGPALIFFTGGMPSPSWIAAFNRILSSLPTAIPSYHWGDIDQGGFRIAAKIRIACMGERLFHPWLMDARQVLATARQQVPSSTRQAMVRSAVAAGWLELAETMVGEVIEQESIPVALPSM